MIRYIISLLVVSCVLAVSCADKVNEIPADAAGRLILYLQDDLADYHSVVITVDTVAVSVPGETGLWNNLYTGSASYDLTTLRNGNRAQLVNTNLPIGFRDSLKIVFHPEEITVNYVSHDLNLKPDIDNIYQEFVMFQISEEQTSTYLIDIDLQTSITYNPDSVAYYFEPDITISNLDSTGGIFGSVVPQSDIYLMDGSAVVTYTRSNAVSNIFGFYGLQTGFYDIIFAPREPYNTSYDTLINYNIPVIAGSDFDMGLLELELK